MVVVIRKQKWIKFTMDAITSGTQTWLQRHESAATKHHPTIWSRASAPIEASEIEEGVTTRRPKHDQVEMVDLLCRCFLFTYRSCNGCHDGWFYCSSFRYLKRPRHGVTVDMGVRETWICVPLNGETPNIKHNIVCYKLTNKNLKLD